MLLKHFACIFLPLLFCLSFLQAASLGVRTLEYKDEARKRPITIELWYPTEETGPFDAATHSTWIHPQEIRNAKISSKQSKYPLLLMSHGYRGDRRERTWLADALAKEGYIVAAIDHYGDTKATFNPLLSLCFWNRPLDFSFALDRLLNELSIQDRIDTEKIGFVGYSLGGMTGLSLAGAQAKNVRAIVLQNIKNYGSGITPEMISQIDFAQSEKNYLEPRIKAILLICPAIFVYPAESLKQIKIPIGLIAAIGDEVLPHKNHSYQIIKYAIPKKLKVMRKEISHYSFLNRLSEMGKKIFQKHLQADPPCCDRASIHREASLFAIDFFKETLKIN